MQEQVQSQGRFATTSAHKYMTQLTKHFGHKVPAVIDGNHAAITFAMGTARLVADESTLTATLSADSAAALSQMRPIIDDHLKRFAFREDFTAMHWDDLPS